MSLVLEIPGGAIDRAAWTMAYFGRTLFYNGPKTSRGERAYLREPATFASAGMVAAMLEAEIDPIDALLARFLASAYAHLGPAERKRREAAWAYKEVTLNARVRLAAALLEPAELARQWARLIPGATGSDGLRIAEIPRDADDKPRIGTPDLVLRGPSAVILAEMKTRGLPSRHPYDPEQLIKYVNLARDERASWPKGEKRAITHVLLRPEEGGTMCWRRDEWFEAPDDGARVVISGLDRRATVSLLARKKRLDHQAALRALSRLPVYERRYAALRAALPASGSEYLPIARSQLDIVVSCAEPRVVPRS